MDIILIRLGPDNKYDAANEPLGLEYLAASLQRKHITVDILDTSVESEREIIQKIRDRNPGILGFYIDQQNIEHSLELAKRFNGKFIVFGGAQASFTSTPLCAIEKVDAVCLGESEETLPELVDAIKKGGNLSSVAGITFREKSKVFTTQPRPTSNMAFSPSRKILEKQIQQKKEVRATRILTSRGCYFNCHFCTTPASRRLNPGPFFRLRPIQSVIKEIADIKKRFGISTFYLNDDLYFYRNPQSKKRAQQIAKEIVQHKLSIDYRAEIRPDSVEEGDQDFLKQLKDSGLTRLFVGIESASNPFLKWLNKKTTRERNKKAIEILKKSGIRTTVGKILFGPDTTWEELAESVDFFHEITACYQILRRPNIKLEAFPGTKIAIELEHQHRLESKPPYLRREYSFANPKVGEFSRMLERHFDDYFNHLRGFIGKVSSIGTSEEEEKDMNQICFEFLRKNISLGDSWNHQFFYRELNKFIKRLK